MATKYTTKKTISKMPSGWGVSTGATTAPKGYVWVNNGKSRFGGKYQQALIKVSALKSVGGSGG